MSENTQDIDHDMEEVDINEILLAQSSLMSEASISLLNLLGNVTGLLGELTEAGAAIEKKSNDDFQVFEDTERSIQKIAKFIRKVQIFLPNIVDERDDMEEQLHNSEAKRKQLENELISAEKKQLEAEQKIIEMNNEEIVQANYTAALGSVLGKMLWKTSKEKSAIETHFNESSIPEYLTVTKITLRSFIKHFKDVLPSEESNEFKFLMSMLGTNVNITAQQIGREYIAENDSVLVELVFKLLSLTHLSNEKLKRMCLMFVYNIALTRKGSEDISSSEENVEILLSYLGTELSDEILFIVLKLLNSLIDKNSSSVIPERVKNQNASQNLKRLMAEGTADIKNLCYELDSKVNPAPV